MSMFNPDLYKAVLAAAAVAALTACTVAPAAAELRWPSTRVAVEVVDRTEGRVLPIYDYGGRRYVVGKPGNEYSIRVRNDSGGRVLAVMSVDGVNVITGETASTNQSGYVFAPGENADIAGWRKDMTRTAAFYFTSLPDSYAARTGRPGNVGVIGVAVYNEKLRPVQNVVPYGLSRKRESGDYRDRMDSAAAEPERAAGAAADAAKSMPAPPAEPQASPSSPPAMQAQKDDARELAQAQPKLRQQLGTGHGRSETSYTQYTSFERASDTPAETIAIYYDSYANLLAMGVPVGPGPVARVRPGPDPFPMRFVPDPR
jgi:hypothetical protein